MVLNLSLVAMSVLLSYWNREFFNALLRENAESVALHGGEADERRGLLERLGHVVENWWGIMVATKRLTFFTSGFAQVASVFPFVVAAPRYFGGALPLGGLTQTAAAFGKVQGGPVLVRGQLRLPDRVARDGGAPRRLPRRGGGCPYRGR